MINTKQSTLDSLWGNNMRKSLALLTSALTTLTLSSAVYATAKTEAKPAAAAGSASLIAVLDVNKILTDSKAAKGLNDQMEKLRVKYETEISKKEEALRAEEKQLTEQSAKMKEADLEKRKKAFEASVADLQKSVMTQQNQLNQGAQDAMDKIRETVVNISKDIAATKGYKYVQPAAAFLYFDAADDITAETVARLDKDLPEVKVSIKDAPAEKVPAKS